jgi:hypothetical protein
MKITLYHPENCKTPFDPIHVYPWEKKRLMNEGFLESLPKKVSESKSELISNNDMPDSDIQKYRETKTEKPFVEDSDALADEEEHYCEWGCGQIAQHQLNSGKWVCNPHYLKCPARKTKQENN